jgi:hypothetical protein
VTNYEIVGHHEGLWTSKVQFLLLFFAFGCFVGLQVSVFDVLFFIGMMLLI